MSELANRLFFRANRSFAHFVAKNKGFTQKTDERIPSADLLHNRVEPFVAQLWALGIVLANS